MSDILCQWLNSELKISKHVEPSSLAKDFSSGYLIGELLHKYQLQDDFDRFSKSRTANSKLNNFSRMEPTLQLLGVPFDLNVAQAIMMEQRGVVTRLLYQLYIVLQKKKKTGLTGVALETLQPAALAKLHSIESEIYNERLKAAVRREADRQLQKVSQRYEVKGREIQEKVSLQQYEEMQKAQKMQEDLRLQSIEKHRLARKRQDEIMARIQAAVVQIPKPPPNRTLKAIELRKHQKKKREAQEVYNEIMQFEKLTEKLSPSAAATSSLSVVQTSFLSNGLSSKLRSPGPEEKAQANNQYIQKIRHRLDEDAAAREQWEKRRRRVLVEQLSAHEAQEEAYREEQLVNRLTRQCQQERRLAVQLMQVRHEKETIRQNRIFREKQYKEQRLREFQEVLDKEALLAKQAEIDHMEEIRKEIERHDKLAAERAEARYRKHHGFCLEVLSQVVDLATRAGEYRELTGNLIPAKLMREWKELFFHGKPLYEQAAVKPQPSEPTAEQIIEMEKMDILDDQDYEEYQHMSGEWAALGSSVVKEPPTNNNILGHVVHRLQDIVNPPQPATPPPHFPASTLKACVLGKLFSGKSTCLSRIATAHHILILSPNILIQEAVQAFQNNEVTEAQESLCSMDKETDRVPHDEAEKPEETSNSSDSDVHSSEQQALLSKKDSKLSVRAQLGAMVEKTLKRGKSVPDELLINIVVEAIRQVPAESGWILDGFPVDISQAKLLEKALSGTDPDKTASKKKKSKTDVIATDPNTPKEPPPPLPVLDLALLFDMSDDMALDRAARQTYEDMSQPAAAAVECLGVKDQTIQRRDRSLQKNQIQHRITAFHDTWPKLEKWFDTQQHILVKVNAEDDEDTLFKKVESVLFETIMNKTGKAEEPMTKEIPVSDAPAPAPESETTPPATAVSTERLPAVKPSRSKSGSKSPKGSNSTRNSAKDRKGRKTDKPGGKEVTRKGSKGSGRSGSDRGRSARVSECSTPEALSRPTPTEPCLPKPGSSEWVYVDEPLPKEITEYLAPYWEDVNATYVTNVKVVMRNLRSERDLIIHQLYDIREEFKQYLKRPDHKQEFVSHWQQDYNSMLDDMREDLETKAELHQRLDDLRERLWDICDNRKEEAMEERSRTMSNGWLEDHTTILINHFSTLIQAEVDRFQDTLRLLRDYYEGMEGSIQEVSLEFARIPLVDIQDDEQQGSPEPAKRIPLIPRRPLSSDLSAGKIKSASTDFEAKEKKLIMDIWQTASTAISNMMSAELQRREAQEEVERLQSAEGKWHKASQASAGINPGKEKKKSSKKKGASPVPEPSPAPTAEENPEELRKKAVKDKIRQEYFGALEHEELAVKVRLELIKSKASAVVRDLLQKAEDAYKEMEEWLGARFLAEMTSIDHLSGVARHHIESATKIYNELVLSASGFFIDGDITLLASPPPPPCPPPIETPLPSSLTILQLETFCKQLSKIAPTGFLSSKVFSDILQELTSLSLGNDLLPDSWMHLSVDQIQELVSLLTLDSELIDWHKFLLLAAYPWPYPTRTELLHTLGRFRALDPGSSGFITKEQFEQTELWFPDQHEHLEPEDPTEPVPFDRLANLKKFLFMLFAEHHAPVARLDYVNMLLYFASHPDPVQGFHRALSIATGTHISPKKPSSQLLQSVPRITEEMALETEEPQTGKEEGVSITALLTVVCHGGTKTENHHRFCSHRKTKKEYSEDFCRIYRELGFGELDKIPYRILSQHSFMLDLIDSSLQYKFTDIHKVLQRLQSQDQAQYLTST
ncbi:sperm flagellar protein 2 [Amia ocellicauda]|uniref:sperm flagellar protein 2 n=1 Tax=Amia ocellicauda TaxID=2972642 RepID=UPI003463F2E6